MHGPYMIPRADIPPLGTGLMPARGFGPADGTGPPRRSRSRCSAAGCRPSPGLRRGRASAGAGPARPDGPGGPGPGRSSPSYDFGSGSVPANVRYVGPQLDDDPDEGSGEQRAGEPGQPLVLVGLSSTVMRQEGLLQRAADALGQLPVRGLVTTGPAVAPAVVSAPDNVTVTRRVRHAECARTARHDTHGGPDRDQSVDRRRAADPAPLGRDQPDNAARVVHAGAGIRLRKNATRRAAGGRQPGHRRSPLPRRRTANGSPAGCRARRQPRRR